MKKSLALSAVLLFFSALLARADIVVLRDGKSYSGFYTGEPGGKLIFQDSAGIQYSFPLSDVQTVVFSNLSDNVSLRSGQMYSGKWIGITRISFRGSNGIGYVFPLRDVSSLVLTHAASSAAAPQSYQGGSSAAQMAPQAVPPAAYAGTAALSKYGQSAPMGQSVIIPSGSQISVRTDTAIDSSKDPVGQLYSARVEQDIVDSTGGVGIPAGTRAELQVIHLNQGNENQGRNNLALDLYSVTLNGKEFRVDSSSVTEKASAGYGANKRTAEYAGGGAAFGALMGAIFGGGKGAGVGALAGGGLGAVGQFLTRGKQVVVPAESTLSFETRQTIVLHP